MANELALKFQLTYTPSAANQVKVAPPQIELTVDMTNSDHMSGTQLIGSGAEEALTVNDIGTLGYIMIKNLDPTNYVNVGPTGALTGVKIKAGETVLFRAGAALFAQANTADCTIQYWAFED